MSIATDELSVEQRLGELWDRLGLRQVHIGSGYALDALTLARAFPERIASMTLVSPARFFAEPLRSFENRVLFISGDRGPGAQTVPALLQELPRARALRLPDYPDAAWSDTVADRRDAVASALIEFLDSVSSVPGAQLQQDDGEVAGITYRVRGSGPPLLLLPMSLARSQWDPILDQLAEHYTTIVVGGPFLGMVPTLEHRMRGGYQAVVRNVVEAARPAAGETILEVGCGSGAVARWLARFTTTGNPITAVDVNGYLLREAANLTRLQGLSDRITYQTGDAESLPLPSNGFDVTLSYTVMEEVDASRMLAEMVRVTRPGGRIGVVVRATDMVPWFNLDLAEQVRRAAELVAGAGADEHGCADASLYARFAAAGLQDLVMGPQYGPDTAERSPDRLRLFTGRIAQGLSADQAQQFRSAVKQATEARTMVWAEPYHCAVGTKS
jgi:SAM-dependent methyltransferase